MKELQMLMLREKKIYEKVTMAIIINNDSIWGDFSGC